MLLGDDTGRRLLGPRLVIEPPGLVTAGRSLAHGLSPYVGRRVVILRRPLPLALDGVGGTPSGPSEHPGGPKPPWGPPGIRRL